MKRTKEMSGGYSLTGPLVGVGGKRARKSAGKRKRKSTAGRRKNSMKSVLKKKYTKAMGY